MGGHRKVFELADNLTSAGNRVNVFIPNYEKKAGDIKSDIVNVKTINFPILRPLVFNLLLFFKLFEVSSKIKPDLIYCRPIISLVPLFFSKLKKALLFFEVNGNPYQNIKNGIYAKLRYCYLWFINHINFSNCDHIVAITTRIKSLIERLHNISLSKISVVESASNPEHFKPLDKKICRRRINISEDLFIAGFAGTLFEYQGIGLVIKAVDFIIPHIKNINILIVGDGVMREKLELEVKTKGLSNYFTFTGQIPYSEVPYYINAMDICLAPMLSTRDEASPLKIYDYLSCGKAVVVSDIDPLRELINKAQCLEVFNPDDYRDMADKIIGLWNDKSKVEVLQNKAREFILNGNTWKENANTIVQIYEKLKNSR
ncbi:MAG: glycosyltransferase family 4 protein [bacterium]